MFGVEMSKYSKGLKYKFLKGGCCALVGRGRCKDEEITVPDKVFLYGIVISVLHDAFKEDKKLRKIVLPHGIKEINNSAFYHCEGLKEIRFPDRLAELGEYAFCGCKNLMEVILPSDVKKVSKGTFAHCE